MNLIEEKRDKRGNLIGNRAKRSDSRVGMCWIENNITHIPLQGGQVALCDEDRFNEVNKFNWFIDKSRNKYIVKARSSKEGHRKLHRFLYPDINSSHIDHINGNLLDNRACNLRPATLLQNAKNQGLSKNNTTGYKGVWLRPCGKKFRAHISSDYKKYSLGDFKTKEEAAIAYDLKAIELHGEFARTNFPIENYLPKK